MISDQKMSGGMGGTAFLCKVRELYPHTVTMILSAYTESNYMLGAMNEAKAYYYLLKPWTKESLMKAVTQALKHYQSTVDARRRFERMQAQLIQSEKMATMSTYSGSMAHNMRNMLMPVLAYVDLIRQDFNDILSETNPEKKEALLQTYSAEILESLVGSEKAIENVNDLIETILSLFRSKQKESEFFDLVPTIEAAIVMEKMRRKWDEIAIHFEKVGNDFGIEALKGYVASNVVEFLKNAGDAIVAKGEKPVKGTIWVTLEDMEMPDGVKGVRLTVRDDGCGMSEAVKKEIFAPLFTTKADVGTGLGLAAVYDMVERHNGMIEVESTLGKGTQFTVALPKRQKEKILFDPNAVILSPTL